jgi:hypothetical protein
MAQIIQGIASQPARPDENALKRRLERALAMRQAGMDFSPVQHWTQGLARLSQALVGAWDEKQAESGLEGVAEARRQKLADVLARSREPGADMRGLMLEAASDPDFASISGPLSSVWEFDERSRAAAEERAFRERDREDEQAFRQAMQNMEIAAARERARASAGPSAPQPKWEMMPTYDESGQVSGFMRVDPVSGQVMQIPLSGAGAPQPAPPAEMPAIPTRQTGLDLLRRNPPPSAPMQPPEPARAGGTYLKPPSKNTIGLDANGNLTLNNPKLTEQQSKDIGFYARADAADRILSQPTDGGGTLQDQMNNTGVNLAANFAPQFLESQVLTGDQQRALQSGREWLAALLRKDTGAAVTPQEFALYGPMYLPIPGDTPETVAQKAEARRRATDAIRLGLTGTPEAILMQYGIGSPLARPGQPAAPPAPTGGGLRRYDAQGNLIP